MKLPTIIRAIKIQLLFHLSFSSWIIKATPLQRWSKKQSILCVKSFRGWETLGFGHSAAKLGLLTLHPAASSAHPYRIKERGQLLDFCTLSWLNGCFSFVFTSFIFVITLRFSIFIIHLFNLFPAKSKKERLFCPFSFLNKGKCLHKIISVFKVSWYKPLIPLSSQSW